MSEAESKAARLEKKAEASEFKGKIEEAQQFRDEAASVVAQAKRSQMDLQIMAEDVLARKRTESENEINVAEEVAR